MTGSSRCSGFTLGGVIEDGNGTVVHGEVQLGDRRIWLHAAAAGLSTPNQANAQTGGIVVLVDDVDAHFAHAEGRRRRRSSASRPTRTTASASTA